MFFSFSFIKLKIRNRMEMNFFFIFMFVLALYLIFDALWFSVFSFNAIYKPQFELLNGSKMNVRKTSSFLTYILLSLGLSLVLYFFYPIDIGESFLVGMIYGFILYGVYNGTNYSTIKNYKLKTVYLDTTWGMIVSGIISTLVSLLS